MKKILTVGLGAIALLTLSACVRTEAGRASRDAYYEDISADVICWTYGERNFEGRSSGKVIYDEGGRLTFVDASNGRLTNVEGDCRVVYDRAK